MDMPTQELLRRATYLANALIALEKEGIQDLPRGTRVAIAEAKIFFSRRARIEAEIAEEEKAKAMKMLHQNRARAAALNAKKRLGY